MSSIPRTPSSPTTPAVRARSSLLYGHAPAWLHRPGQIAPTGDRTRLIIGAKVAAPDTFCINFMGDAGCGMTGPDLETCAPNVPILTVVLNNSTMAIEIPHIKLSHEK